jgi:heat shock protein HslJ
MRNLVNTHWELKAFTVGKMREPVLEGTHVTAFFGAGGNVSGNGGVSSYSGTYSTTKDGPPPSKITVIDLVSTLPGGPEDVLKQEARFFKGLLSATDVQLLTEENLTLSWDSGRFGLEFARLVVKPVSD